jgi:hypothetical protein
VSLREISIQVSYMQLSHSALATSKLQVKALGMYVVSYLYYSAMPSCTKDARSRIYIQ